MGREKASMRNQLHEQKDVRDFQMHPLGPTVTDESAQCSALSLRTYWAFVGMSAEAVAKYCRACTT